MAGGESANRFLTNSGVWDLFKGIRRARARQAEMDISMLVYGAPERLAFADDAKEQAYFVELARQIAIHIRGISDVDALARLLQQISLIQLMVERKRRRDFHRPEERHTGRRTSGETVSSEAEIV